MFYSFQHFKNVTLPWFDLILLGAYVELLCTLTTNVPVMCQNQ